MAVNTESFVPDFTKAAEGGIGPDNDVHHVENVDPDAEFGGKEERMEMEKKLVRRLDARMCILIIIYILNYVSAVYSRFGTISLTCT